MAVEGHGIAEGNIEILSELVNGSRVAGFALIGST